MRLDHIAFRVLNREKTAQFFIDALGYKIQDKFKIPFSDGSTAECIALEPGEKKETGVAWIQTVTNLLPVPGNEDALKYVQQEYHLPPEIFVSDGTPDSIVGKWVAARGVGGIHHMAFQVESVEKTMQEWKNKGYAEFTTDEPIRCPGLTQVFTKPSELTGVIFEFIERGEHGFCRENVAKLMTSTQGL